MLQRLVRLVVRTGVIALVFVFVPTLGWASGWPLTGGGVISRVAGHGERGESGDGGPAVEALLYGPGDLAFDGAGNLYIADWENASVRRVSAATGIITRIAGGRSDRSFCGDGGPATDACLNSMGIAVDSDGNVFITDLFNARVRKVTAATGLITTVAGNGHVGDTGDGGPATAAAVEGPWGVVVDAAGNLYIGNFASGRIRKVTAATGVITTFAGTSAGFSGDGGPATSAQLKNVTGLALDAAGNLYVADAGNCRLRRIAAATGMIATVAGSGCNRATPGSGDGGPATLANLSFPGDVAVDDAGNLYVTDGGRIRKVTGSTGIITTVVGSTRGFSGEGGPGISAHLDGPAGVALDAAGNLYIADAGNHVVQKVAVDDVQLVGDLDGDGKADIVAWHPGNGTWSWLTSSSGYTTLRTRQWGNSQLGDVPLLGDIDGDGKADLFIWRATTGTWYWLTSSTGYSYAAANAKPWGSPGQGDVPLLADLDGDRKADLVIWRASTGTWYWLPSSGGYDYGSAAARRWGDASLGDRPLLGDLDGDGRADLVVWRASTGTFHCLTSRSGYTEGFGKQWGNASLGDIPLLVDMDGDGASDLIVWRRSTGTWFWLTAFGGFHYGAQRQRQWGSPSMPEVPLPADYDGDGRAEPAFWRATGIWFWLNSSGGYTDASSRFLYWVP